MQLHIINILSFFQGKKGTNVKFGGHFECLFLALSSQICEGAYFQE